MSIERGADYYSAIYKQSDEYKKNYNESAYFENWLLIEKLIPKNVKVTELGCGPGQFAELLYDTRDDLVKYSGHDFSNEAIKMCRRDMAGFNFHVTDLTKHEFDEDDNFFVALEILEHTKDFKIIENIGLGKEIIFSLPDFNDPGHVRYFHSVNEVVDRFKHVIKFERVEKFKSWFICKGVTI